MPSNDEQEQRCGVHGPIGLVNSSLTGGDFLQAAAQMRMFNDIQRICEVSTFFDPIEYYPYGLDYKKLQKYLKSSAQRLEALNQLFEGVSYCSVLNPFTYREYRATNAIYSAGLASDKQIWFVAHQDHCAGYGAEDNATALAVMIEIARYFKGTNIEQHLRFASFDLEELGVIGSFMHVEKLSPKELRNIACVIDLECLGSGPHIGIARSVGRERFLSDPDLVQRISNAAGEFGYGNFVVDDFNFFWADHVPFVKRGVPAVSLYSLDHAKYITNRGARSDDRLNRYGSVAHSLKDVPASINSERLWEVVQVMTKFIEQFSSSSTDHTVCQGA